MASLGALLLGPLAPAAALPLSSISDATLWFDQASPASVAMAVLRLVALGLCGYLSLALTLALGVDLFDRACGRAGRGHAAVARLLPTLVRRFVMGTTQVGLVAVTALPASAAPGGPPPADFHPPAIATMTRFGENQRAPSPTATMTRLGPSTSTSTTSTTAVDPRGTATMTRLGSASPTSTTVPTATTSTTIAPETAPTSLAPVPIPPEAPAPAAPGSAPGDQVLGGPVLGDQETWVVHAGDTFWSIAEEALADHRGSFPPQNDVIRYWRQLIAVNQPNLAAPGNPDLLVPGQSLVLPSPR
jgi:hypothetical protein